MAHVVLSIKTSTSSGTTDLAISISAVHSICPITWWTRSNIAFACGFLTVVGLRLIPYESHRCSKCNLNSLPLLYIKYLQCRYLHNQVLFTRRAMHSELLSNISSFLSNSLPLTFIVRCLLTTGSFTISNQLEVGSIMRHKSPKSFWQI